MTYPSFLDKYAGQFAWIFDYRRGGTRELVSGTAATTVGTPQFRRGEINSQVYTSYIHYGDNFDITDWTQPCVYVLDCAWDALATTDFWMPLSKYTAMPGWFIQLYGGGAAGFNLSLQKYVSGGQYVRSAIANQVVSGKWRKRTRSVSVFQDRGLWSAANIVSSIHNGEWLTTPGTVSGLVGAVPAVNAFQNAANFAMLPTLAGWTHGGAVSFAAKIMGTLTTDEIFAIYLELAADKPVIARARKHFSIPYPSMSAAEYAADSCILDLQPSVRDDTMVDLTGNGYDLDLAGGQKDVVQGGPFDEAVQNYGNPGGVTPVVAYGGSTHLTVSGWLCKFGAGAATAVICESSSDFSGGNGRFILLVDGGSTNCFQAGVFTGGGAAANNTALGSLPSGMWQHFAMTYDSTDAVRLYLGGVYRQLANLAGVPGGLSDQVLYVFAQNLTSLPAKLQLGMLKIHTRTMTPSEIREKYLEGNKCLLDARLNRDGSGPVSLAAVTTAQQPIVPELWTVTAQGGLAGSWRVNEDAPTDSRPGKRWLVGSALGYVCARHVAPSFGSWYLQMQKPAGQTIYSVLSNVTGTWISDAAAQGYVLLLTDTQVLLYRFSGGAATLLATATPVGLAASTAYEFWVSRRSDGTFSAWMKGGSFPDWTPLFTVVDTTYTTGAYIGALVNAAGSVGDFIHYSCEMTPEEAADLGIAPPGEDMVAIANIPALSALPDAMYSDRTSLYVMSVRDWFLLDKSSATAADAITVAVTLSGTGRWLRLFRPDPTWVRQGTWYINNATGDDENTGASSPQALATVSEFTRRVQNGTIEQNTTVWIEDDMSASDKPDLTINTKNGSLLAFRGVTTLELTDTVATWTKDQGAVGPNNNDPGTISLTGWTVATHLGRLITFTNGAAATAWAWVSADLGAGEARIGTLLKGALYAYPTGPFEPAPGNTARIYSVPTMYLSSLTVNGTWPLTNSVVFDSLRVTPTSALAFTELYGTLAYAYHTFFDFVWAHAPFVFANCSGCMESAGGAISYAYGGSWAQVQVDMNILRLNFDFLIQDTYPSLWTWAPGFNVYHRGEIDADGYIGLFGTMAYAINMQYGARLNFTSRIIGDVVGTGIRLGAETVVVLDNEDTMTCQCSVSDVEMTLSQPSLFSWADLPYSNPHTGAKVLSHDSSGVNVNGGVSLGVSVGIKGVLAEGVTRHALQDLTAAVNPVPQVVLQNSAIGLLYANLRVAPGVGESVIVTVLLDGVAQVLTCTIAGLNTSANDVDATHFVRVAPGQRVSVQVQTSNNGAFAAADLSVTCKLA